MIEQCSRKICSVEKNSDGFILRDDKNREIWESKSEKKIECCLKENKEKYADYCEKLNNPDRSSVWILKKGLKRKDEFVKYSYINIASCKSKRLAIEINPHIIHLVSTENKTKKAETYRYLWGEDVNTIEFREINIDAYVDSINFLDWFTEDDFIMSLVFANCTPKTPEAKNILMKQRAEFVEGRLAFEYGMKNKEKGGIWSPSGLGLDGYIYKYYENKVNT